MVFKQAKIERYEETAIVFFPANRYASSGQ